MTQVEDFWSIKKISQTHHYRSICRFIISGKYKIWEQMVFKYNGLRYKVEFTMYFNYDKATVVLIYDRSDIFYISIYDPLNTYYDREQIEEADLSDMKDPISKAVRASNYAIDNLFELKYLY